MNRISQFIKHRMFPIMLSTVIVSSICYIYVDVVTTVLFTLLAFVYITLLFAVYNALERSKSTLLRVIAVIAMCIIVFLAAGFPTTGIRASEIWKWFFSPNLDSEYAPRLTMVLVTLFGFFISACMFYFTGVLFRELFIFLICVIPFSLYAKTFTDIPYVYPILIMTLFFFMIAQYKHSSKEMQLNVNNAFYVTVVSFITITTILSMFFPRIEDTPYRKNFDELITGVTISAATLVSYSDYQDTSGSKNDDSASKDEILFYVNAEEPLYLRKQVFDIWNGTVWTEIDSKHYSNGNVYRAESNLKRSGEKLVEAFTEKGAEGLNCATKSREAYIYRNFSTAARAIVAPALTTSVDFDSAYSEIKTYATIQDEFFSGDSRTEHDGYTVSYLSNSFDAETLKKINFGYAVAFTDDNNEYISTAFSDFNDAQSYYADCSYAYEGSKKVKELAAQLTADCDGDYEKALAIERYFYNGEFVYDATFTPRSKSMDYFLFESKRGTCSDFATAMVLLARASGIPARYVEGFVSLEQSSENAYIVRVRDSHAWPELFIFGAGWMQFEPTIPELSGGNTDPASVFVTIGLIILALFLLVSLVAFIIPRLREQLFSSRMKKRRGREQAIMIYNRLCGLMAKLLYVDTAAMTVNEVTERLRTECEIDLSDFGKAYNSAVFGSSDDNEDYSIVYVNAKEAMRKKAKSTKKQRVRREKKA